MQLIFQYPASLESLEVMLATKAYEAIWQSDGSKIIEYYSQYTGLQFQQDAIQVVVHDGQSMSGKDGLPMRLNVNNDTLIKKRNALTHELGHRLLLGNDLYAPEGNSPLDNDEIRVLLFQGDVIQDLYGDADYSFWANTDLNEHTEDHVKDLRYVLSLSKDERRVRLQDIVTEQGS